MWTLHLDDVHLDHMEPHLVVRYGGRKAGKYTSPKNGKIRRVPLNPMALEAMFEWMAYLPAHAKTNPDNLVFPTARGGHHRMKKPPRGWLDWIETLRIRGVTGAPVVWHSLRHTCASMLVSGEWGARLDARGGAGTTRPSIGREHRALRPPRAVGGGEGRGGNEGTR